MIALRRRFHEDRDGGFALIFVLLLTTAIMAAVATTLTVTTPNIVNAKNDQDASAALVAAQSGIDDVVAYLSSVSACRSTTKICAQALGASSVALHRPQLGTDQTFTWTTDSTLTPDEYIRVHSTGHAGSTSRSLTADLSLAPSILSFGYYTDYESQAPNYLEDEYGSRTIDLTNSSTYGKVDASNTSGRRVSVTAPTTVQWSGADGSGDPDPVGICGEHWYYESASSPGRYQSVDSQSGQSIWGEEGTIVTGRTNNSLLRTSTCDVVFTTGMTMDGPIYTRDALYIYDGSSRTGPVFNAPVYTLWGFGNDTTPPPPAAKPWRADKGAGGNVDPTSKYQPQVAGLDLELPTTIGTDGLPDNYCVYYGPTRVVLNGDGTATVTSPYTTTKNPSSDPNCYPASVVGGITNFSLNYKTVGSGTLYVKELGSKPAAGWPDNPTRATNTAAPSNEVFWIPATSGGATSPDTPNGAAAPDTCSSNSYKNTAAYPCAWSNVNSASDGGSSLGWTTYTKTACSSAAVTNRELFECEYSHNTGSTQLSVNQSAGQYDNLRTTFQNDLKTACTTGTISAIETCLAADLNGDLKTANTSQHAYDYAAPANGDHRYLVTNTTTQTAVTGTPQSVGSAPASPMSGDSLFSYSGTPAQETATRTPMTFTVGRQVYSKSGSTGSWGTSSPQFTVTVTRSTWAITSQASGAAYFPNTNDVSDYSTGANSSGAAAGANGANQPGDLYIEGANSGKVSMVAQDDVVVTNDITSPKDSSYDDVYNPNTNAVDIVAGTNVRNYHPVQCVDQNDLDINTTSVGWCPNDITGLYTGGMSSSDSANPARQYTNMNSTGARTIDAALFALSGSFLTDNYNRGVPLGNLTVNGGIYQSHRGANGVTGSTSGYSLQYHYIDLEHANLPYAPPATGGSTSRVWNVVSVSAGSS